MNTRDGKMTLRIHILVIAVLAFVGGCVNPEAQRLYVEATKASEAGNIEVCIDRLERARELMPDSSSAIRNNLSVCYYKAGRNREGWFELRQAVIINPLNKYAKQNFMYRWDKFKAAGILVVGATAPEIRSAMGKPDVEAVFKDGSEMWIYGSGTLRFKEGRLAEVE